MSDLTAIEKMKLERLFEMQGGYVLDFSNRTFQDFFMDNFGIDIMGGRYLFESGSKANRLRGFWKNEPNHVVAHLTEKLLEYCKATKLINGVETSAQEEVLHSECQRICERLKQGGSVENIDAIQPNASDRDFTLLAQSIRESITKNQPEVALDRLHTFMTKFVRELCTRHAISYSTDTPLHSLFGQYLRFLHENSFLESDMTKKILKSSLDNLDSFNVVRNNHSMAHANAILNYSESILIFNNISNLVRFIQSLEAEITQKTRPDITNVLEEINIDDIPF